MKKKQLIDNDLVETSFWHLTNKANIESIEKSGLMPRNGERKEGLVSKEDPDKRVFFSQGLKSTLEQANNLAYLIYDCIKHQTPNKEGFKGNDKELNELRNKMTQFQKNSTKDENKTGQTGGFIDIMTFISKELFINGISDNINEQVLEEITFNIVKSIWETSVFLKGNLEEGIDYSSNDYNYSSSGEAKVIMEKRNMHAYKDKGISSDKLEIMVDEQENYMSAWDVYKRMAITYKTKYPNEKTLPAEKVESGYMDENGNVVIIGEKTRKDFLSIFIEKDNAYLKNGFEDALEGESLKLSKEQEIYKMVNNLISNKNEKIVGE